MHDFSNITVQQIRRLFVVRPIKGYKDHMANRKNFGLVLCRRGHLTFTMNGKNYISNQQNALLLPLGATYTLSANQEGLFPLINFRCSGFTCSEILEISLKNPQAYLNLFDTMQDLHLKGHRLEVFSLFYKMLHNLSHENVSPLYTLAPAVEYIEEHLSDSNLSNTTLAQTMDISEVYLRKLFLAQFKTTPKQYILNLRIQKAKYMLLETPYTVTAISEECGFSNPYHFSRIFKQRTGFTPRQYAASTSAYEI